MEIINQELSGDVRDFYLTTQLCLSIDRNRGNFDKTYINQIHSEELKDFLRKRYNSETVLEKGSKVPYFYLADSTGKYFESHDFTGKILLINFWATWCKPCFKEFPYENDLVDRYKDKPVEIINICLDSSLDTWENTIRNHNLKTTNLFSTDDWNKKLYNNFGISALPHSVLVDWEGNIVQNKCPFASQNISESIELLVLKMSERK